MSVFPLEIPEKINSPELLAFFQQFGLDRYLSAEEINKITAALAELKELSVNVSIVNTIFLNNGFEKLDQLFKGFAGSEWNINGFNYTNPTDQEITIPLCATGKVRMDRIVLDTLNNFVLVQGVEVDENPVAEAKPVDTLDYTFIPVNDTDSGEPTPIITGDIYQEKKFDLAQVFNGTGSDVVIELNKLGRRVIILNGPMTSISGLFMDAPLINEYPHEGKIFVFINQTNHDITFRHFDTDPDISFIFKKEVDLVLPPGERIEFMLRSGIMDEHKKSWVTQSDVIGLLASLASKANLVAGKVPASELPSYVDDVLEYGNLASFPVTGEASKIYLALDTNFTYRWTGSVYLKISDTGKLDKITSAGVERFYTINADGTQSTKNISELGGGSQYVRGFYPALSDGTINTWQTWALNTSNMLASNFNNSLGTGAVPAWADYNFITIVNASKLSQLIFSSNQSYISKNYEIIVESFDLVHGVGDLYTLTNKQTLIHQTLSTSASGSLTLKTNFTIANHTLNPNGTAIRMAWRYIGGGPGYQLLGTQFLWKFDN